LQPNRDFRRGEAAWVQSAHDRAVSCVVNAANIAYQWGRPRVTQADGASRPNRDQDTGGCIDRSCLNESATLGFRWDIRWRGLEFGGCVSPAPGVWRVAASRCHLALSSEGLRLGVTGDLVTSTPSVLRGGQLAASKRCAALIMLDTIWATVDTSPMSPTPAPAG
jgi:hypothetical protein